MRRGWSSCPAAGRLRMALCYGLSTPRHLLHLLFPLLPKTAMNLTRIFFRKNISLDAAWVQPPPARQWISNLTTPEKYYKTLMLWAFCKLVNSASTGRGPKHHYFLQIPRGSDVQPSLRTSSQGDCVSVGMSEGEGWQKYWTRDTTWITEED